MFGRNKFKKLKREDVVEAIITLNKQQDDLESGIVSKSEEVDKLMERGCKEKNRDIKLLLAKKVTALKSEIKRDTNRAAFLMYNVGLLEKLKAAIDDNSFVQNTSNIPLNKLLSDQKALAQFLESAIKNKSEVENTLVDANQIFDSYEQAAESSSSPIYSTSESDDELLAMFEMQEQLDSEMAVGADMPTGANRQKTGIEE